MKLLTIIGARPQFIKAGNLSRQIAKTADLKEVIVHTGQHYDANMSDVFFNEMKIPKPDYYLGVGGESHGAMTGRMMSKIEEIAMQEKPDFIVVYGDTNSTLSGALVASKLHINLAHIEAGLRSFNMKMPEEINRIVTDRVSNLLFCPTNTSMENLKNESFPFNCPNFKQQIYNVGDIMQDGAIFYSKFAKKPNVTIDDEFILCTIHRAENTDDENRLRDIFDALIQISKESKIILPLHPRTKKQLNTFSIKIGPNINIIDPVGYLEMVWLISNSNLILTDSGGLQKEAYFFHKNCMVLRDETEWVELINAKFNAIATTSKEKIQDIYHNFSFNRDFSSNLYGDGKSSEKIIKYIIEF